MPYSLESLQLKQKTLSCYWVTLEDRFLTCFTPPFQILGGLIYWAGLVNVEMCNRQVIHTKPRSLSHMAFLLSTIETKSQHDRTCQRQRDHPDCLELHIWKGACPLFWEKATKGVVCSLILEFEEASDPRQRCRLRPIVTHLQPTSYYTGTPQGKKEHLRI